MEVFCFLRQRVQAKFLSLCFFDMRASDRLFEITMSAGERAGSFEPLLSSSRAHTSLPSLAKVIGPNFVFETCFDADPPDRFIAFAKSVR
jgi:hypothetical protein